jgi:hypothetical protein
MDIFKIFITIAKAHLLIVLIIISSFLIEKLTGLKLLIDHYTWKKSSKNRKVLSTGDAGYYFIINLAVFIYYHYKEDTTDLVTFSIIWFIVISIMTYIFYKIHFKYQKIDPNKSDNDYT